MYEQCRGTLGMWFVDARLTSQLSYHKSSVETDLGRHRFGSNLSSAERFKNTSPIPRHHFMLYPRGVSQHGLT